MTDFVDGFAAGARRAAPRVKVLVDYSDDFVDPTKCAALARRQIARGAGIVFNVAGACGLGTMKAAAESGVWAVGVDSDQSSLGPHVLTSVLKRYEAGFVEVFQRVKAGKLPTGRDTTLTMRDGAADSAISPRSPTTSSTRSGSSSGRSSPAASGSTARPPTDGPPTTRSVKRRPRRAPWTTTSTPRPPCGIPPRSLRSPRSACDLSVAKFVVQTAPSP